MMNSHISGTRFCAQTNQLLVSTGIPALDAILGGGLPVGTITLLEEDIHGAYSKIVLKYYLAEGIVNKHSLFLASQDVSPHKIIKDLPAVIESDVETRNSSTNTASSDKMKIAFRYQNLPTGEAEPVQHFGHHFDLTKTMPPDLLESTDISCWDGNTMELEKSTFENPAYGVLLRNIKRKIKESKLFLKDGHEKKTVLRIGIHSLGSPMWMSSRKDFFNSLHQNRDLDQFIFSLRALVRSAHALALVTIPSHLYREASLQRCIHSSDIAMRLQSFCGTDLEFNPSLSDYHGFFHLTKMAAINSFCSKHPGPVDYAFKLRRKKFTIEKLHLPPDVQEVNDSRKENIPSLGCGSANRHLLEF